MKNKWIIFLIIAAAGYWLIRRKSATSQATVSGGLSGAARGGPSGTARMKTSKVNPIVVPTVDPASMDRAPIRAPKPLDTSEGLKPTKRNLKQRVLDEYNSGRGFLPKFNNHTL